MAIDFAAMLAHERRRKKELAEKEAALRKAEVVSRIDICHVRHPHRLLGGPPELSYLGDFLSADEAAALEHAISTEHSSTEWLALPQRRLLNLGGVPHPNGMIAQTLPMWLEPLMAKLMKTGAFPEGVVPDQVLLNRYNVGDGIDPHADGPLFEPYVAIVSLQSTALLQFLEPPGNSIDTSTNMAEPCYTSSSSANSDRCETPSRLAVSWETLDPAVATVVLQPGSLFIFSGDAYTQFVHGIATPDVEGLHGARHLDSRCVNLDYIAPKFQIGDEIPQGPRLSLTIRAVRKVAVPAGEFLTQEQHEEARRRREWWARAVSEKRHQ